MKKQPSNEGIIPAMLAYHGKVLSTCGDLPKIFPPEGRFLWENFNSFAESHYLGRRESSGVIPMISGGREILLFFDTFSPGTAPNMQLFFDESITSYAGDDDNPRFLYEKLLLGGLSPAVSEDIFLEKYLRVMTVASFFDAELSQNAMRRINLCEILKKATDLFSARNGGMKSPEIHVMPQVTENAETLSSPLAFCAVVILSLSLLCAGDPDSGRTSMCVSKRDELFEISIYTNSPNPGESVAHSDSHSVLSDIFPDKSNEATLLFRMADAARLSVGYGTEGNRFYVSVSFKAHALPSSVKAVQITETEEKILSVLADFLI